MTRRETDLMLEGLKRLKRFKVFKLNRLQEERKFQRLTLEQEINDINNLINKLKL